MSIGVNYSLSVSEIAGSNKNLAQLLPPASLSTVQRIVVGCDLDFGVAEYGRASGQKSFFLLPALPVRSSLDWPCSCL